MHYVYDYLNNDSKGKLHSVLTRTARRLFGRVLVSWHCSPDIQNTNTMTINPT